MSKALPLRLCVKISIRAKITFPDFSFLNLLRRYKNVKSGKVISAQSLTFPNFSFLKYGKVIFARILILLFLFFFAGSIHALEQTPYPFSSNIDAHRFELLTKEVRCVVCQNQNLADSNAPLANDLREKIYRMVLEQKSNEEIKDYLVKRYGEFILLQPRFNNVTLILWAFPFLGLTTALLFLIRLLRSPTGNI